MKKDIIQPEVKNVALAVVKETTDDANETNWYVYIINLNDTALTDVIINSKGYGVINEQSRQTSVLRHYFKEIGPESFAKIEVIMADVFGLSNEYWVSFYQGTQIYDKKYIFLPETINEGNYTNIPLMNKKGVMIG